MLKGEYLNFFAIVKLIFAILFDLHIRWNEATLFSVSILFKCLRSEEFIPLCRDEKLIFQAIEIIIATDLPDISSYSCIEGDDIGDHVHL